MADPIPESRFIRSQRQPSESASNGSMEIKRIGEHV